MKKLIIVLLLGSSFLFTGCTVVRIDTQSIDNTINVVLSKNNELYNRVGKGYKYYVPRGVTYIDTNELNEKLYSNGTYYYLYIDAISYYHKAKLKYKQNSDAYYSRIIKINDKEGYLEINEQKDKYFIEFNYNYARIEALVEKEKMNETILNASYILSTVKFNNNVIKLMLNENYLTNKEESYNLFKDKNEEENIYLEYDKNNETSEKTSDKEKNEVN